jgi:hypothetical protein
MKGTITELNSSRVGVIQAENGTKHFILPHSFQRTAIIALGANVSFNSHNLLAGATAMDIEAVYE